MLSSHFYNMQNPFESGHIKNYILLYASVVVIMILFFFASSLFNDIEAVETKVFSTELHEELKTDKVIEKPEEKKFKLMDNAY